MSTTTNLGLFKHDNPATNTNAFDVKTALNDNWDKIDVAYKEVEDNFEKITTTRIVVIGDSYLRGDHNGIASVNGWGHYLKNTLGISNSDFFSFSEGGAGFYKTGDGGHTFQTLLEANISNITNKTTITKVIICGGCNDREQSENNITNAMSSMISYCKTQFPNAIIYIGMIGNNASIDDETYRRNVILKSLYCYKKCVYYGAKYLTGVEYLMHNYEYYDNTDNTHPTQEGYKLIGKAIFNLLNGYPYYQSTNLIGKISFEWNSDFAVNNSSSNMGFTLNINGTSKQIFINGGTAYITASNISFSDNLLKLTNKLPFNLNYRNFYQNYTPGWAGSLYIQFTNEETHRLVNGYYMIRNHTLYFQTFGENNKVISSIYVPSSNYFNDLLTT